MENQTEKTLSYSYYALSLLMLVYVINFLDRQIIYISFPAIKAEMAFSDLQLALLVCPISCALSVICLLIGGNSLNKTK